MGSHYQDSNLGWFKFWKIWSPRRNESYVHRPKSPRRRTNHEAGVVPAETPAEQHKGHPPTIRSTLRTSETGGPSLKMPHEEGTWNLLTGLEKVEDDDDVFGQSSTFVARNDLMPNDERAEQTLPHQLQNLLNSQRSLAATIGQQINEQVLHSATCEQLSHHVSRLLSNVDELETAFKHILFDDTGRTGLRKASSMEDSALYEHPRSLQDLIPPSMEATFQIAQSQASEYGSEVVPTPVQEYYDAAGWTGVLRERLLDLQYDHSDELQREGLRRKRLDQTLNTLHDTGSEIEFRRAEAELIDDIDKAEKSARELLQRCLDQNLPVTHRPRSSFEESLASPLSLTPPNRLHTKTIQSTTLVNPPSSYEDGEPLAARRRSSKNSEKPQQWPFADARSLITQWIQNVFQHSYGDAEPMLDTLSITSLPEYVLVDKYPVGIQETSGKTNIRELDVAQRQDRIRMPAKRRFAYTRMFHSDSSLPRPGHLGKVPSSPLRRHSYDETLKPTVTPRGL